MITQYILLLEPGCIQLYFISFTDNSNSCKCACALTSASVSVSVRSQPKHGFRGGCSKRKQCKCMEIAFK